MAGTFSVGESKTRPGVYHRRYSVGGGEVAGAPCPIAEWRRHGHHSRKLGPAEPGCCV